MNIELNLNLKKLKFLTIAQIKGEAELSIVLERFTKKRVINELINALDNAGLKGLIKIDGNEYKISNGDVDHLQMPLLHDPNFIISRKRNSKHQYVGDVQTLLVALGYSEELEIDGLYGEKTAKAVIWFQQNNELKADGVLGKETLAKLLIVASK